MSIKDGRKLSHDTLETYRMRAINLRNQRKKVKDIAAFFGVHPASVSRWIGKYNTGGKESLKSKKATGRPIRLSMTETKRILNCLKKPATDYGYPNPLWTCKRVKQVIKKETNKSYSDVGIWKFLKRLRLTNQKPERSAIEQNPDDVQRWLKEEWPKIKAHAKRWQAMLYFQDEAGISLIPVLGKTWAPIGKTPVVKVTGKKGGFVISSAISTGGRMVFRIEKEKITAEVFIDFLRKIRLHHSGRKVIVVADKAPVHIAKKVRDFADENKSRFAIYYLPSYSPKLNCDEHVWEYLKNKKLINHTATSVRELKRLTLSSMWSMQKQKFLLKSFIYGDLFNTN